MHPDPDYMKQQRYRWLLTCLDHSPSNELALTQEMIANVLGVRREGITEVAGKLQHAGLIHYRRGHITVLDPDGLEKRACECCQNVKMEFDRLLPNVTATDAIEMPCIRISNTRLVGREAPQPHVHVAPAH